jgi:hypothetical protein
MAERGEGKNPESRIQNPEVGTEREGTIGLLQRLLGRRSEMWLLAGAYTLSH